MKRMRFLFSAVAILAIMASCNKEESYSVSFEQTGYYFKWGGEPQTYHYTTHNVSLISVSTVTEGWTCTVDNASIARMREISAFAVSSKAKGNWTF